MQDVPYEQRSWYASTGVALGVIGLVANTAAGMGLALLVAGGEQQIPWVWLALVAWFLGAVASVVVLHRAGSLGPGPMRVISTISLSLFVFGTAPGAVALLGAPETPQTRGTTIRVDQTDDPISEEGEPDDGVTPPTDPVIQERFQFAGVAAEVLPDVTGTVSEIMRLAGNASEATSLLARIGTTAAEQAAKSAVSEIFTTIGEVGREQLQKALSDETGELEDAIVADLTTAMEERFDATDEELAELQEQVRRYAREVIERLQAQAADGDPTLPPRGVVRWAGSDRFETAAEVARNAYPDGSRVVYVATGDDFPDAFAAARVGEVFAGPLLLVNRTAPLPRATLDALDDLRPETVVIVGGQEAISDEVETQLRDRYSSTG